MSKSSQKKNGPDSGDHNGKCLEGMPIPVVDADMSLAIQFANSKARNLFGLRKKRIDFSLRDLIMIDHQPQFDECIAKLKDKGDTCLVPLNVVKKNGAGLQSSLQFSVVVGPNNSLMIRMFVMEPSPPSPLGGSIVVDNDVLKAIIETSHDGLAILGDDYVIEYVSDSACKLFGGSRKSLIGHDFREFMSHDVSSLVTGHYKRRRKGEAAPRTYPIEIIRADGSIKLVEINADVITSPGGKLRTIAHFLDITDREETKKRLQDSERRSRTLIESMNDGLTMDNKDSVIVFANEAFCSMLGYSRKQIVGKPWTDLTRDKDHALTERLREDRMSGKADRYEMWWVTRTGEHIPTIVSATPYFSPEGEFVGSFAVVTDISDFKETEETVQFYLDLLTHDVANQLQVIMTSAGLLEADLPHPYIEEAKEDILDAVERCNRLITKVKRAGEIRKLPLEDVELTKVLQEKVVVLERVFGATVHVDIPEKPIHVKADLLLGELVWNLLENAARHNPKADKQVWVSSRREAGMVKLSIADNGPGVSKTRKRSLLSSDRTKRHSGVGLTLILQMARKYGGRIELSNRVKGKPNLGAKFILWLHEADLPHSGK